MGLEWLKYEVREITFPLNLSYSAIHSQRSIGVFFFRLAIQKVINWRPSQVNQRGNRFRWIILLYCKATSGVPNHRAMACSELGHGSGGPVGVRSSTCTCNRQVSKHAQLHLCEQRARVLTTCKWSCACSPACFTQNHPLFPYPSLQSWKGWRLLDYVNRIFQVWRSSHHI